jgi:hypothetical protein
VADFWSFNKENFMRLLQDEIDAVNLNRPRGQKIQASVVEYYANLVDPINLEVGTNDPLAEDALLSKRNPEMESSIRDSAGPLTLDMRALPDFFLKIGALADEVRRPHNRNQDWAIVIDQELPDAIRSHFVGLLYRIFPTRLTVIDSLPVGADQVQGIPLKRIFRLYLARNFSLNDQKVSLFFAPTTTERPPLERFKHDRF